MNLAELKPLIAETRILVIGDAMLDDYVEGVANRISPEAPVLVMNQTHSKLHAGGAANVARNLTALGGGAHLIAVTGADSRADDLKDLLDDDNPQSRLSHCLIKDKTRPTSLKTRFIAQGQHLLRIDDEVSAPINADLQQKILTAIKAEIANCDIVILSDYGKGVLNESSLPAIIGLIKQHGKRVIIDPKKHDFSLFQGADIITPNRNELKIATQMPVSNDAEISAAANHLRQKYQLKALLITRSEQGMSYIDGDFQHHIGAHLQAVFDVAGAGDTVIAALTIMLAARQKAGQTAGQNVGQTQQTQAQAQPREAIIKEAMAFANLAAAVSVSKRGTATVRIEEIQRFIAQNRLRRGTEKIMNLKELSAQCEKWRAEGLKIGFTNGCFDILHSGHVHSLTEAADSSDRLIVALNSDASVKRLKGNSRPINSQTSRAFVLAGLASCDAVIIFDEDTPMNLIENLRPDILFKGEDYALKDIVGADFVASYGGAVKRLSLIADISSTALIEKVLTTS